MATATCYVIDSSAFSRNSDIQPSLLEASRQAVLQRMRGFQNESQSSASVVSFGEHSSLECPQTSAKVAIMRAVERLDYQPQYSQTKKVFGAAELKAAISFALLAIGQRQNKEAQGVVELYLSSPFSLTKEESQKELKRLQKENVKARVYLVGRMACELALEGAEEQLQVTRCLTQIPAPTAAGGAQEQQGGDEEDDLQLQQALALSQQEYYENIKRQREGNGNPQNQ